MIPINPPICPLTRLVCPESSECAWWESSCGACALAAIAFYLKEVYENGRSSV
jgi:hypothetical protein